MKSKGISQEELMIKIEFQGRPFPKWESEQRRPDLENNYNG